MKFVMYFLEVRVGDMGVDLGSGDIGVSKHGLNGADVGAIHQEIGGEAMSQSVRGNMFGDTGKFGIFLDDTLDRTGGQTAIIA